MIREFLNEIFNKDNSDGVAFVPVSDEDMNINGFHYKDKGKYITGNTGQYYHVLLYKQTEDMVITECDHFEAILLDPSVYVTNLIKCGYYGIVSKVTEVSRPEITRTYEEMLLKMNPEIT
jgi:hypothetical protein